MKKYLLIAPLAIAIIASSCNKSQEKVSPAPKPNAKALAFYCERTWDSFKQQCTSYVGDCLPSMDPIPLPDTPTDVLWHLIMDDIFTDPTWSVPDIGLTSTQIAYFTTTYGITSSELNNMNAYDFFDMLSPSFLTETEFNTFVNDYTHTTYWDDADSRLDLVFTPKSSGSDVTLEMNLDIVEP